jgi:hypothetical protein
MGWTSKRYNRATHTTFTSEEALKFLKEENRDYEILEFHLKPALMKSEHNECYMVMRHFERMKIFIAVTIIDIVDGEIFWKELTESDGPIYHNCPVAFFKYLEAPNNYAKEWRNECKAKKIPFKHISEYC